MAGRFRPREPGGEDPARRRVLGSAVLLGLWTVLEPVLARRAAAAEPEGTAPHADRADPSRGDAPRIRTAAADLDRALAAIERDVGGRLGVAVLARDGRRVGGHREAERFPMCSTFKLLLAAHVLAHVQAGRERLDREVPIARTDLVTYSPVVETQVDRGTMRVDALCEAAVTRSDNAAANVLLRETGGPAGLTRFVRTLDDGVTRLDRIEPALNEAAPGDPRDTTSPAAMAATLRALLFGGALRDGPRATLETWLRGNLTGDTRLRAGLAPGWLAGEKTGSGERGSTNDVGVLWAPDGTPWIVAAFLTDCSAVRESREAALARVAQAVVAAVA
jgi:beta-lactamase class A